MGAELGVEAEVGVQGVNKSWILLVLVDRWGGWVSQERELIRFGN